MDTTDVKTIVTETPQEYLTISDQLSKLPRELAIRAIAYAIANQKTGGYDLDTKVEDVSDAVDKGIAWIHTSETGQLWDKVHSVAKLYDNDEIPLSVMHDNAMEALRGLPSHLAKTKPSYDGVEVDLRTAEPFYNPPLTGEELKLALREALMEA